MVAPARPPRAHEAYAWVLLLLSGLPMLFGSLAHLVSGEPLAAGLQFASERLGATSSGPVAESPTAIAGFVRVMAVFGLALFVLFTAMVATSYRRGERWAWFAAWTYPAAIVGFAFVASTHGGWSNGEATWAGTGIAIQLVVILLGLLLPFRRFFPKRGERAAAAG